MSTPKPDGHPLQQFRSVAERTRPTLPALLQRPRPHPLRLRPLPVWIAGFSALALFVAAVMPLRYPASPAPIASSLALSLPSDQWFVSFDADPLPALSHARWPHAGSALSAIED